MRVGRGVRGEADGGDGQCEGGMKGKGGRGVSVGQS